MTSQGRAAAARAGLELPKIIADIAAAWEQAGSEPEPIARFISRLHAVDVHLEPGTRAQVVARHASGFLVGSLDRLVDTDIASVVAHLITQAEDQHVRVEEVQPADLGAHAGRP